MTAEIPQNPNDKDCRDFHIGDILSITTGHLVSPRHMDGIYDILNYMTGDDLFTHQLPRAMEQCKPHLLQQHPQLEEVDTTSVSEKNWERWLGQQAVKYGQELPVKPLSLRSRVIKDPLTELEEMVGSDRIITINIEDLKNLQ